jgi:hypothetical protein
MLVDLTKLVILLIGYALYGPPDDWDKAMSVQLSMQFDPVSARLELAYDPVAIFFQPNTGDKGGWALPSYVVVSTDDDIAVNVHLQHETAHVWQYRTYGLLMPLLYPTGIWEPNPYVWNNLNMPNPRQLNWSLFRIWVPLGGW